MKAFIRKIINILGFDLLKVQKPSRVSTISSKTILDMKTVERVFSFYEKVPPFYSEENILPELKIAGAWRKDLFERRRNQIKYIKDKDYVNYRKLQDNMFFNELVSGLWNYEYHSEKKQYLNPLFSRAVEYCEFITDLNLSELSSFKGYSSWGLERSGNVIKYTDPWHIGQAYNISNVLKCIGSSLSKKNIVVDLGSGFGGMVEKLVRIHQNNLDIYLIDIPLNLTTAYCYLSKQYPEDCYLISDNKELEQTINTLSSKRRIIFVPTILIPSMKDLKIDVLHNSGSFSEMDYATIDFYLKSLCGPTTQFLIETNSNKPVENYGLHIEIPSSTFPIPKTHKLFSRHYPIDFLANGGRYVTSIYKKM